MLPDPIPKHAVLLQGPNGPFFRRYARDLEAAGARVTKFNFHPGDALFFRGESAISFRGSLAEWPDAFREYAVREEVDAVLLFGDCRPVHKAVREATEELSIAVWVFEEGYIRPDFITLERGGVNGNSSLPNRASYFREAASCLPPLSPPQSVGNTFWWSAFWTILNALANTLFGWRYPHYKHHRDINAVRQGLLWIRGGYRKLAKGVRQRHLLPQFEGEWSGRYFLVPLQVYCDSQVGHTTFGDVGDFIAEVTRTFAASAPSDSRLVFKHHPHDRPYRDYRKLIGKLATEHGLEDRLVYVHDLHLPTLLKNACGTIVMNSTVGLSSLFHKTPVKALGDAVYNIPELTFQGPLEQFFRNPGVVDEELYEAFSRTIRYTTQVNGTFNKRLAGTGTASGLARREHDERVVLPSTRARPATQSEASRG